MSGDAIHISRSEAQTAQIAAGFAADVQDGDIICLFGTLGMGKSVFARSLIRTLCGDENLDVPSPTFTLVQTYDALEGFPIWHFDLYRLKDAEEIYELGWEEALSEGIALIEWPERLGALKPRKTIEITLSSGDTPEERRIDIKRP